jgi:very-short-patch-repair endonuclease
VALDTEAIAARYKAGESVKALAASCGVYRERIARELTQMGIPLRGATEAGVAWWDKHRGDRATVERVCGGMWKRNTGRQQPLSQRVKIARTRYNHLTHVGRHETDIAARLRAAGLTDVRQQFPVGPYNLDIAIEESLVAIEVQSVQVARNTTSARTERVEYLLGAGWYCLFIVAHNRPIDAARATEKCIAFAKLARRDPAAGGKYGMIGGDGEPVPAARCHLTSRTRVPGF